MRSGHVHAGDSAADHTVAATRTTRSDGFSIRTGTAIYCMAGGAALGSVGGTAGTVIGLVFGLIVGVLPRDSGRASSGRSTAGLS